MCVCVFMIFFFCVCCEITLLCFLAYILCNVFFPSSIICRSRLVARYYLNLVLSWNTLVCQLQWQIILLGIVAWAGHCVLLCLCKTCEGSSVFIILVEKFGIILIGLPSYDTLSFPHIAFNIVFLFCSFSLLVIMWGEEFLFCFNVVGDLWTFCMYMAVSFLG